MLNCKILNEKLKIIENSQENVQYEDIFADHKKLKNGHIKILKAPQHQKTPIRKQSTKPEQPKWVAEV